jgi:Fe2+ transport system protein FeoA
MAMGLLPGTAIQLMQNFPSYVFKLGYTQFAVDKKIADEIFVKLSPGTS